MSAMFAAGFLLRRLQNASRRLVSGSAWLLTLPIRIGIAGRLGVAFAGVAVLAIAANLFAEHGLTIVGLTAERVMSKDPNASLWIRRYVARASSSVFEAIERLDRAIETRARNNVPPTASALTHATDEFDREIGAYVAAARMFAEAGRLQALTAQAQDHVAKGVTLVRDADRRRGLSIQYTTTLAVLSARVQERIDRAWKVFGRVIGRQSLVDLNRTLAAVRLQSERLVAGDSYDRAMLQALSDNDARITSLLETNSRGLARAEGQEWLEQVCSDIDQLRSLRAQLTTLDQRSASATSTFKAGARALANAIRAADAAPPRSNGSALGQVREALKPISQDGSTLTARLTEEGRRLLWISAIVLSILLLLSIATTLSIVRPVGRFIKAMRRLSLGDSSARMPRGGLKELDVLAVAFNQMAEQISAYQRQLESKVTERTLQFEHLSEHDPLTQLPNRQQLLTHLQHALGRATQMRERVAVLFIDLDNFKTINDSMGHGFGDHVLVSIAQRIREVVGSTAFIARLGGDEFTVVYEGSQTESELSEAGRHLVQAFAAPLRVDGLDLSISASVGASVFPDHAQTAEALLSAADVALFHAKASGRKQLGLFSPALLQAASERFRIEQGLRRAIDGGEFELFFQPEVAFATFTTNVLEALLRWRTSRGTYVAPGEFLAVAEQSGLILEIGDWVLTRAIQRTGAWYRAGRTDVRVAINVSARQLLQPGFVTRVKELLEAERLPASRIELELTENVLQTDSATVGVLRTLRSESIAVALDDFGTGYSSLASLEQLPLTRVKLDRSLIAGIHTSSRSLSIAQSIIDLCRKLGLEITAEGVEYREQLSLLIPERTVHIQGFLVSRPVPEAEVPRLIEGLPARMRALLSEDPIRAAISNAPSGPEKSYRPTVSRTRSGKGRK